MPTPDFWRDVFLPALLSSANPYNKSIGEYIVGTAFLLLVGLNVYRIYQKQGLNNKKVKGARDTIAIVGVAWLGLFVFNLVSIPFNHWIKTAQKTTEAESKLVKAELAAKPPDAPPTRSEPPQAKGKQPSIKQESKGDQSPNIVGDNNQVNSPVNVYPEKGWRKFTNQEISVAASALSQFVGTSAKITVVNPAFSGDTRLTLANQIESILKAAKWDTTLQQATRIYGTTFNMPIGLHLLAREKTKAFETLAETLSLLVGRSNFGTLVGDRADSNYTVEIQVWAKPE